MGWGALAMRPYAMGTPLCREPLYAVAGEAGKDVVVTGWLGVGHLGADSSRMARLMAF